MQGRSRPVRLRRTRIVIAVPTFREMLAEAKAAVRQIDPAQAEQELSAEKAVVLDVREPDEYEQGALSGAVHIPRGTLETSVEGRIPDKSSHLVVYCAGGTRSAFAAKTLQELGYTCLLYTSPS